MPRPPRVEFPDALYHVTTRGVHKAPIIVDDHDRVRWMEYLKQAVTRFGLRLYAFVLMDNHFHLFVCTPNANLGKAMQYLNGSYAMYFNTRHEKSGHIFERRYHAVLVENEGHYTEVSRYIHLNPVRAGIVAQPKDYAWSSYPIFHWGRMALPWLDCEEVLGEFGEGKEARQRYRNFVADGMNKKIASPRSKAIGGWLLGSHRFAAKIYAMLASDNNNGRWDSRAAVSQNHLDASLDEIARGVCKSFGIPKELLKKKSADTRGARNAFIYIARHKAGASLESIASYIEIGNKGTISRTAKRERELIQKNRRHRELISRITSTISKQ